METTLERGRNLQEEHTGPAYHDETVWMLEFQSILLIEWRWERWRQSQAAIHRRSLSNGIHGCGSSHWTIQPENVFRLMMATGPIRRSSSNRLSNCSLRF